MHHVTGRTVRMRRARTGQNGSPGRLRHDQRLQWKQPATTTAVTRGPGGGREGSGAAEQRPGRRSRSGKAPTQTRGYGRARRARPRAVPPHHKVSPPDGPAQAEPHRADEGGSGAGRYDPPLCPLAEVAARLDGPATAPDPPPPRDWLAGVPRGSLQGQAGEIQSIPVEITKLVRLTQYYSPRLHSY